MRAGPFTRDETLVSRGSRSDLDPERRQGACGDVLLADADARLDGPFVRRRRCPAGPRHGSGPRRRGRIAIATPSRSSSGCRRDKVRLIYLDGAGCYGMNGHEDAAADAAILSQAVGRPVRVQWMRHDEHGWDPKGPPQLLDLAGAVDGDGRILDWRTEMWLPEATKGLPNIPLLAPAAAGLGQPQGLATGLISQNGDPPYAVEQLERGRALAQGRAAAPVQHPRAGQDRQLVRGRELHRRARRRRGRRTQSRSGWRSSPTRAAIEVVKRGGRDDGLASRAVAGPGRGRASSRAGRGFSYVHYKHNESLVAIGMEVAVDARARRDPRGAGRAARTTAGSMINPDAVKAQVEGNIIQTLSRALLRGGPRSTARASPASIGRAIRS